jgi:hypothetical protein
MVTANRMKEIEETGQMRSEELRKAKDRRPFRPFSIRMADGKELEVRHPDAVAWGSDRSRIVWYISPSDDWVTIDIALVTSLAGPAPSPSPSGDSPAAEPGAEGNGV